MTIRLRGVIAGTVLSCVLVGCGVPTDDSPRTLADDDLPASLRPDGATTTTLPSAEQDIVGVYFIRGKKLVRELDALPASAPLRSVLGILQRGPSEAQAKAGDRSALAGEDLIRRADVAGSTASIDLDAAFSETPSTDQILALGQLVLTATGIPRITSVRLTVDGEPTQVPRGDGSLTGRPLTARDYRSLLAG